jgi:hypothetical protein
MPESRVTFLKSRTARELVEAIRQVSRGDH